MPTDYLRVLPATIMLSINPLLIRAPHSSEPITILPYLTSITHVHQSRTRRTKIPATTLNRLLLPELDFVDPQFVTGSITSVVLVITLGFTIRTYRRLRKTDQIKLAHDFFLLYKELQDKRALLEQQDKSKGEKEWKEWAERYFDNLEWFSYLVNTEQIKDPRLLAFYEDIILVSYEKGLPIFYSQEKINKKNFYPELKELYDKLKNGKIAVYRYNTGSDSL